MRIKVVMVSWFVVFGVLQGGVVLMLLALFMSVGRRAAAKKLAVDLGGRFFLCVCVCVWGGGGRGR